MLTTPLGNIIIEIDNKSIPYDAVPLPIDESFKDVEGRYCIWVSFIPDGHKHTITCSIKNYHPTEKDCVEPGEHLELKSFYHESHKLSIGMEGDSGYLPDGSRLSDDYDYDNEYTANGVKYVIFPGTVSTRYAFGIAWIDADKDANGIQTWVAADPTIK